MNIIFVFLFAISVNIDNLTIGLAYGIRKIKIKIQSNILIALVSCIGTFLSMYFGNIICYFLPRNISNVLGGFILILLGIWFILKFYIMDKDTEKYNNINISENINLKESLILSLALTINNIGVSIATGFIKTNLLINFLFIFIFSILFIIIGENIGKSYLSQFLEKHTHIVSSLIFILLGFYNIVH